MIQLDLSKMVLPLGRASRYGTIEVDCDKFAPHVAEFIFEYGIRQLLNDAMATKTDKDGNDLSDDEIVTKAYIRRDNLYSGELRRASTSNGSNPFEIECYAEAKAMVIANLKKSGKWSAPKATKERFLFCVNAATGSAYENERAILDKVLAGPQGGAIKKRAKATVDARGADKSLDDLF